MFDHHDNEDGFAFAFKLGIKFMALQDDLNTFATRISDAVNNIRTDIATLNIRISDLEAQVTPPDTSTLAAAVTDLETVAPAPPAPPSV
jgi:hypothetical protein